MNTENPIDQKQETNFTDFFEYTVNAFYDPNFANQKEEIEKKLDEWRSDLCFVPNLLECIETTKFPNPLFIASLCIKFLLEKFNEEIPISTIQDIFTGIAHRLNNFYDGIKEDPEFQEKKDDIIAEFYKCRINLLQCICLIQLYFPDFIEKWHVFTADDSKILFGFLFEEEERQVPDAHNIFMKKISIISIDCIKKNLNDSEMSPEWLFLFKYALQKAPEIGSYSDFWPKLSVVPDNPVLYSSFIDVFEECISNEYFFLSEKSGDFMERIFDICIDLIGNLLSPPLDELSIQMASYLWKEIFDYDYEFLCDRYLTIGKKSVRDPNMQIIDLLIEQLEVIIDIDEEFFVICESIGKTFNSLIENKPNIFCEPIFRFLSVLIDIINDDPDKYVSDELAVPFNEVSQNSEEPQVIDFFKCIIQPHDIEGELIIQPGAIFGVASSSDSIIKKFALIISDNILEFSYKLPTSVIVYFICQCCQFCGQRIHRLVDFTFNTIDTGNDSSSTKCIVKLCKYHPQIIIDSEENFTRICDFLNETSENDIDVIVNSIQSLLYIMDYVGCEHQCYQQSIDAISDGIISRLSHFYDDDENCKFCLQLINNYATMVDQTLSDIKNLSMISDFLTSLCSSIIDTINFSNVFYGFEEIEEENNDDNQEDQAQIAFKLSNFIQIELCNFVSLSLDSNLINNKSYIVSWIGLSLSKNPVTEHFDLLAKLVDFFPNDDIVNFILDVGSSGDNELMLASLTFTKKLANDKWEPFFETFPDDYFLGPLESPDLRIIDIALETISALIDMEVEFNATYFENDHYDVMIKITDGVFTNFEDIEIRKSINIWIKLFEAEFVLPGNLTDFVLSRIHEKCAEFHSFCEALFVDPDLGYDRMLILRTVYSLKASLAAST